MKISKKVLLTAMIAIFFNNVSLAEGWTIQNYHNALQKIADSCKNNKNKSKAYCSGDFDRIVASCKSNKNTKEAIYSCLVGSFATTGEENLDLIFDYSAKACEKGIANPVVKEYVAGCGMAHFVFLGLSITTDTDPSEILTMEKRICGNPAFKKIIIQSQGEAVGCRN